MITEYYRPKTIEEALILIARPNTVPLGGGTVLNQPNNVDFAVVDLQTLNLNQIRKNGNYLEIGATVTMQTLLESKHTPTALINAIKREGNINLRQIGTVAGALVSSKGCSTFSTAILALDSKLILLPDEQVVTIGNLFPLRKELLKNKLIIKITIPLQVKLAFEYIARTPADRPLVCVAIAQWPSGRTRLALGGFGDSPVLAMDGNETSGIEATARNAFQEAADVWASAEYRMEIAAVLTKRCCTSLKDN